MRVSSTYWATLFVLIAAAVSVVSCDSGTDSSAACVTRADCGAGLLCVAGQCVPGCLNNGDCPNGYCVEGLCQLHPPEQCDCLPESACTATAPECNVEQPDEPCVSESACDDDNNCSLDACVQGACRHTAAPLTGCCDEDEGCDDGDPCTVDRCVDYHCVNDYRPNCCDTADDCDDGDPCTEDTCEDFICQHGLPDPNCCRHDAACRDTTECTADRCVGGVCVNPIVLDREDCRCAGTGDCDDRNPCTLDRCIEGVCNYLPLEVAEDGSRQCCSDVEDCDRPASGFSVSCDLSICVQTALVPCTSARECDDSDACTIDACTDGVCVNDRVDNPLCCNTVSDCPRINDCAIPECVYNRCDYSPSTAEGCCVDHFDCNDGVACTLDICEEYTCVYRPDGEACCVDDTDCDDLNDCTVDTCGDDYRCTHVVESASCCTRNDQCGDGDPCTEDRCSQNLCVNPPIPGCCVEDEDCPAAADCTSVDCVENRCQIRYLGDCCTSSAFCWDGDACTEDQCVSGTCVFTELSGCCRNDDECPAGGACTIGRCVAGACTVAPLEDCCVSDADCDDGDDVCTNDLCVASACVHTSTGLDGCCLVDDDCVSDDVCLEGLCRADGSCAFERIPECCTEVTVCNDGDYCTDDACSSANRCENVFNGAPGCCSGWAWAEGFDTSEHGFLFEQSDAYTRWHVDPNRPHLGDTSLYFGRAPWYDYDGLGGGIVRGTATSPPLSLPRGQAYELQLFVLIDVRPELDYDRFELRVLRDGELTAVLWTREQLAAVGGNTGGAYLPITAWLDAFAGQTVQLQFYFDSVSPPTSSVDGLEGIYVDTINLEAQCD